MYEQLNEIIEIVKRLVGSDYLYFDDAIEVKRTPHTQGFRAWAVCVSPGCELWVMDSDEDWFRVQENDILLIPSIYQRIKVIESKYKAA